MKEYEAPIMQLLIWNASDSLMESNGLVFDDFLNFKPTISDAVKEALEL